MIKKGDILNGLVKEINEHGIVVKTFNNIRFFIPYSLVSDFKKFRNESYFEINQKINFVVESYEFEKFSGIGNFKINHPVFCRSPFKNSIKETKGGFYNLKIKLDETIESYIQNKDI
ncbi:S1 RNA-binding domain-containing protein [Mycoplasmopsis felifaucium]|uniref:S1 RNA-binding domain-containing protein n=1 Tax=Mycoplasmopsis felifaucium TaxID=35768 RepID=UPI0004865ED9|nr:S1 RNA-binding domain-containing protein [Mycoplasmopsis felifaucium]